MKIKNSIYNNIIEVLCILLLVGISVYLIINWSSIPNQIPGHYDGAGNVDRWGGKGELLILPITSWILYIFITILEAFPQIWNTGVTVTKENRERVYRILKNMISTVKLLMVVAFTYLCAKQSMRAALPSYFTPLFLLLMFGILAYFITKLIKSE
jgi:uncharacterized membrane protein